MELVRSNLAVILRYRILKSRPDEDTKNTIYRKPYYFIIPDTIQHLCRL